MIDSIGNIFQVTKDFLHDAIMNTDKNVQSKSVGSGSSYTEYVQGPIEDIKSSIYINETLKKQIRLIQEKIAALDK
ncbi:unnamed protein product [Rhizopus stolonifer]